MSGVLGTAVHRLGGQDHGGEDYHGVAEVLGENDAGGAWGGAQTELFGGGEEVAGVGLGEVKACCVLRVACSEGRNCDGF